MLDASDGRFPAARVAQVPHATPFRLGRLHPISQTIEELKDIINRVNVVDLKKAGEEEVGIGSVVMVSINGSQHEFTIVGEWEADPAAKKISHESPLGKALIGKKVGDNVEVEAPVGKVTYAIKAVK